MKITLKKELPKFISATVALTVLALVINFLSWKYKLISGGFPGYGLIASYLTGYSVGTILFGLNSLIIISSFIITGKKTGLRAIYGYLFFSFIIDATRYVFNIQQAPIDDYLKSSIFLTLQGLIAGSTVAVLIKNGYSAGGWVTFVFIVKKFINIKPRVFFLAMDVILALIASLNYGFINGLLLFLNALAFYWGVKLTTNLLNKKNKND